MLTKEQKKSIEEYVNPDYYDVDKLNRYLDMHNIVGNEIFQYCDKHKENKDRPTYSSYLDNDTYCQPLSVDKFVRRIPFFFYTHEQKEFHDLESMGDLDDIYSASSHDILKGTHTIEEIFEILEYTFYKLKLPLVHIFSYWINQTGYIKGEGFFQWYEYLKLREGQPNIDYFPVRFITAYNEALEENGHDPIIYEAYDLPNGRYYYRDGTKIKFEGQFPCDRDGKPILKWIGIRTKNVGEISCDCEKSEVGLLIVTIKPNSVIYLLNIYNDEGEDDFWYQVYAGPQCMEFDYGILKYQRKILNFTQQQVADAIGATVRTYQKWENGETTPDGHFLLRLMNWLDIRDAQDAVEYTDV